MTETAGERCRRLWNFGHDIKDIAKQVGLTVRQTEALLEFQALPSQFHQSIKAGLIDFDTAFATFRENRCNITQTINDLTSLLEQADARPKTVEIIISDCRRYLRGKTNAFDAIITDPPYEINLHAKSWDRSGISFSSGLWNAFFRAVKPGGFIAAFAAGRRYHRLAMAAEKAGFTVFPFLAWNITGSALPKPANLSEMFDRKNKVERIVVGRRPGSGFTAANVRHGQQQRRTFRFDVLLRYISDEARMWRGYYYGLTCFAPTLEPILLAQKPIDGRHIVTHFRKWRTGAINIDAIRDRTGEWPGLTLSHPRDYREHGLVGHLNVKPVALMADLCTLLCPPGGLILDPFAGTGTTGVATLRTGHRCVLVEQNEELRQTIERRLDDPEPKCEVRAKPHRHKPASDRRRYDSENHHHELVTER